ncbi:Aste57867_16243 [Aphanomyces stellatus]|uniref:Aste57867_16243 protein n=1 Tax=Aphanomyces stellatus TaxID=120398 RepID=A0A485L6D0_9STRA|nr:hypothetical protein As57867_016186 [Aphanomyces stellatus]VFT93021.1 Aste57867_16243 [Aphanomyces stellatus]
MSSSIFPSLIRDGNCGVLYFDLAQWNAFRPSYQRNNKNGGMKNLRCFPDCCNGVHAKTSFCGSPVTIHFQRLGLHRASSHVHVVAQFAPITDSGMPRWATFATLPSPSDPDWYVGNCVSVDGLEIVMSLNTIAKVWHYG